MKNQKHLQELENTVKSIYAKADAREKAGCDPVATGWQATLEVMLLLMGLTLQDRPGQLLPVQIANDDEGDFFADILKVIDLPPDTHAVLYTPSAFKDMPLPRSPEVELDGNASWQRNAYSVIVSDTQDHRVIIQAALPGLKHAGIDVFDDGVHIVDYSYNTIEECLNELPQIIWNYFQPKGKWTKEQIEQYTESWFAKSLDIDLDKVSLRQEYSYIHHPEILKLSFLDSMFKLILALVPKEYDSLEDLIEVANDLNEDFNLGLSFITKEGLLKDDEAECKALIARITVDIDQFFEKLDYVDDIQSYDPHSDEYLQGFYDTAKKIYEKIVGRPWPDVISISGAVNGDHDLNDDENE